MAEKNNSLEKALKVLDLFQKRTRLTLTEAAQATGYSITSISRVLNTLQDSHYIYQDKLNGGYYLTDKLYILGTKTQLQNQLINVIDGPIERLCLRTGFTVTVSVRTGSESTIVIKKEPENALALMHHGGETMDLNCTATGKVLVAFSRDPEKITEMMSFRRLTPNTVTDRTEFLGLLDEVRERLLAYDMEEVTEGLVCIAAPVLDIEGYAVCAVSVSGYKDSMIKRLDGNSEFLREAARECEALLR